MQIVLISIMACAILLSTRTAAGFVSRQRMAVNHCKLSMTFLDDLTRTFSSLSGGVKATKFYTIGITGSSGLLGTALINELENQQALNGKPIRIVRLTRSEAIDGSRLGEESTGIVSLPWNPKGSNPENVIDLSALEKIDAIVHLAGENVATGLGTLGFLGIRPWTDAKKAEIVNSRVGPTEALAKAIATSKTPTTFVTASGVGIYGGDFVGSNKAAVDETMDTSTTTGFLAKISRAWEEATLPAAGRNRVVNARLGVVMSKNGGALGKLYPIFSLGGGGNVGSGNQYFTFISARDAARALIHTLSTPSLNGPVNICAPVPCTNAEFTSAFGKVLSRPTILPLPAFVVSALFGEMGDEMLLGGVRAIPGKLTKSGFQFNHPTITEALQSAVDETI